MGVLGIIDKELTALGVPYAFMRWKKPVTGPYFVGELTETEPMTGDGLQESTLLLDGFHRGEYIDLEAFKETIKKHFHPIHGLRRQTDDGYAVIFYAGAFYVPTGEADLKRIQVTLRIKEWKVY
jgi:hypothetical protein